jgi:hypothetical protein
MAYLPQQLLRGRQRFVRNRRPLLLPWHGIPILIPLAILEGEGFQWMVNELSIGGKSQTIRERRSIEVEDNLRYLRDRPFIISTELRGVPTSQHRREDPHSPFAGPLDPKADEGGAYMQ